MNINQYYQQQEENSTLQCLKYVLSDDQFDGSVGAVRVRLTQCFDRFPHIDDATKQNSVHLHFTISLLSRNSIHG